MRFVKYIKNILVKYENIYMCMSSACADKMYTEVHMHDLIKSKKALHIFNDCRCNEHN